MDFTRRIDAIERRIPDTARLQFLAVYKDIEEEDVFWQHSPYSQDKGRMYTREELNELAPEYLLVVEHVKDWRQA